MGLPFEKGGRPLVRVPTPATADSPGVAPCRTRGRHSDFGPCSSRLFPLFFNPTKQVEPETFFGSGCGNNQNRSRALPLSGQIDFGLSDALLMNTWGDARLRKCLIRLPRPARKGTTTA